MSKKGLLKWAGGKEREMPILEKSFPLKINNYFEPFVGGGSVYLSTSAKNYYINDFYNELYQFYKFIIKQDKNFEKDLVLLDNLWSDTTQFFSNNTENFLKFMQIRHEKEADLENFVNGMTQNFYENVYSIKYAVLAEEEINFKKIFHKVVKDKIKRILKHEAGKGLLSEVDLKENFKSALKSAIYTYIRSIYNYHRIKGQLENPLYIACFYFIRNYCYSSMFRFNSNNEFNVPYGGLSYNENYLGKKIDYIYSQDNLAKYKLTEIKNLDFEKFLNSYDFSEHDFIFLDPPYDSDFSDYAENSFTQDDQRRLADFLLNIKAKFLLVIKKTDFIESLYTNSRFKVESFEKKYQVSFKNRNNKNVEHLIITNY